MTVIIYYLFFSFILQLKNKYGDAFLRGNNGKSLTPWNPLNLQLKEGVIMFVLLVNI